MPSPAPRDEWAARECAHPDCDGWRMHSVEAKRDEHGTYVPACPICGRLPVIGSFATPEAARAAVDHNQAEHCVGQCRAWFDEDAA